MIHFGNNIDVLKQYPDNYFDSVVTDPPYGLGKEPDAMEVMQAWIKDGFYEVKGAGFMGKEWDAFVPQPLFWKEVYRVLKPGAHVLSFFGTRTYDWGVMAMRFAGFEVRDCIQWLYGSGFPKSHNIGKAVDKLEGNEREIVPSTRHSGRVENSPYHAKGIVDKIPTNSKGNSKWEGWGSALKPANEPIVLARKPLEKGLSIAENVLKWSTGGINIDGCRVGTEGATERSHQSEYPKKEDGTEDRSGHWARVGHSIKELNKGRFPANLILTHHPECECKGLKKIKPSNGSGKASDKGGGFSKGMFGDGTSDNIGGSFVDENGQETIEDWNCHPGCPIRIMDEQSGIVKGVYGMNVKMNKNSNIYGKYDSKSNTKINYGISDIGGASRFFYCAKSSKSERNRGLEDIFQKSNSHPTVKPVKLMQYLVRLITPPNGIVLDPFAGSGTTAVAAKLESVQYVCIEQNKEYYEICKARICVDAQCLKNKYKQQKLF